MDPIASGRNLLPVDHQAAADSCPPWLTDRLDELLHEMEMLNTWFTSAPASQTSAEPLNSLIHFDSPDLYAGDTPPSYDTPKIRDFGE
jgi:hypothetical protein